MVMEEDRIKKMKNNIYSYCVIQKDNTIVVGFTNASVLFIGLTICYLL